MGFLFHWMAPVLRNTTNKGQDEVFLQYMHHYKLVIVTRKQWSTNEILFSDDILHVFLIIKYTLIE